MRLKIRRWGCKLYRKKDLLRDMDVPKAQIETGEKLPPQTELAEKYKHCHRYQDVGCSVSFENRLRYSEQETLRPSKRGVKTNRSKS